MRKLVTLKLGAGDKGAQKGDRPLCPLSTHFGRLRDLWVGDRVVPFLRGIFLSVFGLFLAVFVGSFGEVVFVDVGVESASEKTKPSSDGS
jgi:hypothetical protein